VAIVRPDAGQGLTFIQTSPWPLNLNCEWPLNSYAGDCTNNLDQAPGSAIELTIHLLRCGRMVQEGA
jgi:hypothetical protein